MFQQNNKMSSIVGPDFKVEGDISVKGDIIIYGIVNGNINCNGLITMSKEAVVSGDIVTTNGDISGKIQGGLKASGKVSLSSSAILEGDLSASILVVQNGAIFNGMCIMNNKKKNISINKTKKIANLNVNSKK